jgi:prophage endopeptidase
MTSIQRTAIALLVVLLVVFGLYKWGYGRGWGDRDAEMQAAIAKANEQSRAKEQEMSAAVQAKEVELRKANDVIDKKQTDLSAAIRAGRLRLPTSSCVQAPANATPAAGNSAEARAEPDRTADKAADTERETLALIAQIAADGDKAINQLNACIAAYEDVRRTINADAR